MRASTLLSILCSITAAWLAPRDAYSDPPIKIGVVSGLTGIAAKWNHFQNNGIRLAQEEYNSAGIPVEVIFEDSQTMGAKSISAFNKLIEFDRVDGVIGADFGFAVALTSFG